MNTITQIADLIHPTSKFIRRFIWKDDSDKVTVLRYSSLGNYDGLDRRADRTTIRRLWQNYIDNGWVHTPMALADVDTATMAAIKYLEGPPTRRKPTIRKPAVRK